MIENIKLTILFTARSGSATGLWRARHVGSYVLGVVLRLR